ncbi:MAG: PAS domain S-box protein [Myxococcales bacterium]|nr:PAS domain S-box protein [Myxococcales bacterium]
MRAWLENFFQHSLDGVLLTRTDGTIVRANPAACRALERSEADLCQIGLAGLVESGARLEDVMAQRAADVPLAVDLTFCLPSGERLPAEITLGRLPASQDPAVDYVMLRDLRAHRRAEAVLRAAQRTLLLLTRCNEEVLRASSEDALFGAVCRVMVEVGGYRMCWVGIAEHDVARTVRPVARAGDDDGYLDVVGVEWSDGPLGNGPVGQAIRSGQAVVGHDFAHDEALRPWAADAVARGYRSATSLPIVHEGERLGAITMYSGQLDSFDAAEVALLGDLARNVAYGVTVLRQRAARVAAEDAREELIVALAAEKERLAVAVEEARARAAELEAVLDAVPAGVFIVRDREARHVHANRFGAQLLGQPHGASVAVGAPAGERPTNLKIMRGGIEVAPVDLPGRIAAAQGVTVSDYEFEVVYSDGSVRHLLGGASPLRDANGDIIGSAGAYVDVTARREAEAAHRRSEALLKAITDAVPDPIFLKDTAGRWMFANPAALEVLGKTLEEVIGKTDLEITADQTAAAPIEDVDRRVMRSGVVEVLDEVVPTPSGDRRFRSTKAPFRDPAGAIAGVVGCAFDMTELKAAEASRERLITAIEQAAESVVVTDPDGNIEYANPAFEEITGYSRAEALGKNPRFLKSGQHDEAFYRALWATLTSGQTWRGRLVNRHKSGRLYTEEASISPVRDPHGQVTSYVAVKRDITRDLDLESQLRQAQKMEGIGRLAGGIAHDFNNLLSVILSYATFASEALVEGDPVRDDVREINRAAERAATLTRQILAFSRKQVLQPVALDLNHVLGEMEKMLRRVIGEDIALLLVTDPDLGRVTVDPSQIDQVVMNLAINARDAMPRGGTLTISTANVEHDADYLARHPTGVAGPHVRLTMTDSGAGMDETTVARIFEPFFTTKGVGSGTGLGLSTVYGIVKQSDGSISVTSAPGRGTTFEIDLPRRAGASTRLASPPPVASASPATETVLVVDDNDGVRSLTQRILAGAGYTVLVAANGGEALLHSERHAGPIDLVVTDVVMPLLGGPELVTRLSQDRPGVRALYMSGYADDAVGNHGLIDADAALLAKPFTPKDLVRKVRDALDAPRRHPHGERPDSEVPQEFSDGGERGPTTMR